MPRQLPVGAPLVALVVTVSLIAACGAHAATAKSTYVKQMDAFATALDNDMNPVYVTSLQKAQAAFPGAKAKLAEAERKLAAIVPPAPIAADQKQLVVVADQFVSALDAAVAGKLDGVSAAKGDALEATLKKWELKLEVASEKIVKAGYDIGS